MYRYMATIAVGILMAGVGGCTGLDQERLATSVERVGDAIVAEIRNQPITTVGGNVLASASSITL